ncbi:MAG TPA: hypothetical protein VG456_13870 [Candidatus Sulfopaludibacter sp.]|jgi:hypothetical protein|nr:hypothetical protein [Candidatus Sulfopaludibacter sp.]
MLDRYAHGELTPAESRELARRSLEDPELFEELTAIALAKAAVAPAPQRIRPATWRRNAGIGIAVAAGIALLAVAVTRFGHPGTPAARTAQPVLLASGLLQHDGVVFRGGETAARDPRMSGRVLSIEDGAVTVDLGSLDGLAKGSLLPVLRGGHEAARLGVTFVFRERAQARLLSGPSVRAGDEVRVPPAARLRALLDQVDAQYARGETAAARATAYQAAQLSESASLAERPASWNRLAVLLILNGEYQAAEAPLRLAVSTLSPTDSLYPQCLNNLAALSEISGDRRRAAELYAQALTAFVHGPEADRQVIESNLNRVKGSR